MDWSTTRRPTLAALCTLLALCAVAAPCAAARRHVRRPPSVVVVPEVPQPYAPGDAARLPTIVVLPIGATATLDAYGCFAVTWRDGTVRSYGPGTQIVMEVNDAVHVDTPPRVMSREVARCVRCDARLPQTVHLFVLIGGNGQPADIRLAPGHVSCNREVEAAARSSVLQWRFTPAMWKGRPVPAWLSVDIEVKGD
jgi:hypothetical protein